MATLQHTDELYHILEDEICALKILPGEALSENQLCKRFGVSRTPIRSVLQRLEQNRFVQIIPCKGTIVTAIDTGVVDQLIFQRVAVEGMVFRDFVQSCSPMEILAVEHLYNMLLEAAAGRSDPENFDFNHFLSCDLAMHEYWFHKTSKEYLWEQMTRPQADYSRFIRLDIVGARNVSSVVSEHAEMLRILREKDLDAIEPLMRTHLYALEQVGLADFADAFPAELSGGMRQRLAMARALTCDADLLLMDEPLSALDALLREEMQDMLKRCWREQGYAQVLVTHSIEEAVYLGQRIVVMSPRPGRVVHVLENAEMQQENWRDADLFFERCRTLREMLRDIVAKEEVAHA